MYNLVIVFTDENTTVEQLLEPFGLNQKIKNKEILISKDSLIIEERLKIGNSISEYRKTSEIFGISKLEKEKMIASKNKLEEFLNNASDEEIYKYAIRVYDKELISSEGHIYNPYNPYAKWASYNKNSDHTKFFVIENPQKEGELIRVNSAKIKDLKWDVLKYGIVPSENSIMPDGTWYEENTGTCIKVHKDDEQKITLERKHIGEEIIKNNPEWVANIVEYYI